MVDLLVSDGWLVLRKVELAEVLKTSQGQISRLEKRDMLLSTLGAYLTALGVDAKVVIEVDGQTLTYDLMRREATDDPTDRHDEPEPPPCCPVLLELPDRRDHLSLVGTHHARCVCLTFRASLHPDRRAAVPPIALPRRRPRDSTRCPGWSVRAGLHMGASLLLQAIGVGALR